jgi:hypothetical protein
MIATSFGSTRALGAEIDARPNVVLTTVCLKKKVRDREGADANARHARSTCRSWRAARYKLRPDRTQVTFGRTCDGAFRVR